MNLATNKQKNETTKKEWANKERTRTREQKENERTENERTENERTESERTKEWKNDWDERTSLQTYAALIRNNIITTSRLFNDWWDKIINIKSIKLINNSFNEKDKRKKKRTKISHYRLTSRNAENDVLTFDTILQCWAIQRISFSVVLIKFSSLMNLSSTIKENDDDVDFALIDFINRKINQNEQSRDSLFI